MVGFFCFFFVVEILLCQVWASQSCKEEKRSVGTIEDVSDDEDVKYLECWDISVPPNRFVQVKILNLEFHPEECRNLSLEIKVKDTSEIYTFCSGDSIRNPITSLTDIRIIFHYFDHFAGHQPSFRLQFEIRDIECTRQEIFRCSNNSCIPKNEVCDGIEDCEDGADEKGCQTGIIKTKGVPEALSNEAAWIKSKRTSSWGWHENTPRVVTALYLAGYAKFDGTNMEEELMAKQTELKTSVALLKNFLSDEQLSMFINGLLVTCHNPRNFYGQNLIKRLREQVQSSNNFTHPIAYLTLCNANDSWPQKASEDLHKILSSNSDYPFLRDYQAISVMAVSCYEKQTEFLNATENLNVKTHYEKVIQLFKQMQLSDGSFGNLPTTSLIAQALVSSGQEYAKGWKLNATVQYLVQNLAIPHDLLSSYIVLPVLNAKSLSDVAKVDCSLNPIRRGYDRYASGISDYPGPKIRVQYSLFVGDQRDIIHTISLRVPENYTAFDVMELAETEDPKFTFKYKTISGMMYVYQIGEVTNDPESGLFWLLYQGLTNITNNLNHYNIGPDQLVVQDKEHFVMWYKKALF